MKYAYVRENNVKYSIYVGRVVAFHTYIRFTCVLEIRAGGWCEQDTPDWLQLQEMFYDSAFNIQFAPVHQLWP